MYDLFNFNISVAAESQTQSMKLLFLYSFVYPVQFGLLINHIINFGAFLTSLFSSGGFYANHVWAGYSLSISPVSKWESPVNINRDC